MSDAVFSEPAHEVVVSVLAVSCIVGPLDQRADAVMRRVVPRSARSRRPDGTTAVSLARLQALADALTAAGFVVQLNDEKGARR